MTKQTIHFSSSIYRFQLVDMRTFIVLPALLASFFQICFLSVCVAQEAINTQKLELPFTPPEQALEMISLPNGFTATLFAHEPDVQQPIAATMDHKGRLWVVECLTYSDGKTNYDLRQNDRVSIFEDSDNDGRFDQKIVFWDQGKKLTGIELGFGGVWLTAAPEFIFIPDRNGDDKPDGPPEVLLDGFEDNVIRHNIVNGLRWGPDGWLYGRHGIQATSFVGPPGATKSQRIPMNCAIWRFHPVHRKFEKVAEGSTNPWGFDYDEHGEMFMINTVIGHLFHVVPGARYRRMYGSHFNPHTYQVIEQTADHFHWDQGEQPAEAGNKEGLSSSTDLAGGGHAHTGLMIYQGGNWPREYHNSLFTANFHGRRINNDTIHRDGNGYVGRHASDFMKTADPWFRGVELIAGPDGAVFVLDWSDIGECHENDGIHRTSGRIFKISYRGTGENLVTPSMHRKLTQPFDLAELDVEELLELLNTENNWYPRMVRRLLAEKAVSQPTRIARIASRIKDKYSLLRTQGADDSEFLNAIWLCYVMGGADESFLLNQCSNEESEHVRSWAVRLLADGLKRPSDAVVKRFCELAQSDPSGLVRLYLASSLNRFDELTRLQIANLLCQHESDADDRTQSHLIWYRIEPDVIANWQVALDLAADSKLPLIRENIVRRITSEIQSAPEAVDAIVRGLQNGILEPASTLRGMKLALEGWSSAAAPQNWPDVSKQLLGSKDESIKEAVTNLGVVFGDGRAIEDLRKIAISDAADVAIRRRAIESWAATKPAELESILKELIRDQSLTTQVVRSMVFCETPTIANVILDRVPHMTPEGKSAAINTLVSRESWSLALLSAIEDNRIDRGDVNAFHAQQMSTFPNQILREKLRNVWGTIRSTQEEKANTISILTEQLFTNGSKLVDHDVSTGRVLFESNCSACHTLFGVGGNTGPDLTGGNRQNLNYLLTNIVDPSGSVAQSYQASIILLDDGRLVNGLILGQNRQTVRVQTPEEVIVISRDSIDEIRSSKKSVMPDGLLNNLSIQQKADLIGYLMSPSQVPLPGN